jgi:hypothetical protein
LLDEEGSEVGELPGAGNAEGGELDKHPANYTAVGGFGLISEFGLTFLFQCVSLCCLVQDIIEEE